MPITTKAVNLNPTHGEVLLIMIQGYVIKFVSDLRQVSGSLLVLRFPPPIKLTYVITEILLKVALNTIILPSLMKITYYFAWMFDIDIYKLQFT